MIDDDMLDAMRQLLEPINSRLEKLENTAREIKVIIDADIRRDISLLSEGHELMLERLPDPAVQEAMDARLSAVEAVVKLHNRQIQDLKKAQ